jgi:hypothetical protein
MGVQSSFQALAAGAAIAASSLAFNPPAQAAQQPQPDIKSTGMPPPAGDLDALREQLASPSAKGGSALSSGAPPAQVIAPAQPAPATGPQDAATMTPEQRTQEALQLRSSITVSEQLAIGVKNWQRVMRENDAQAGSREVVGMIFRANEENRELIAGMRPLTPSTPEVKAYGEQYNRENLEWRSGEARKLTDHVLTMRGGSIDWVSNRDNQIDDNRANTPVIGGILKGVTDTGRIFDSTGPGANPRNDETKAAVQGVRVRLARLGLPADILTIPEADARPTVEAWSKATVDFAADQAGLLPISLGDSTLAPAAATAEQINVLRVNAASQGATVEESIATLRNRITADLQKDFDTGLEAMRSQLAEYGTRTARGEKIAPEAAAEEERSASKLEESMGKRDKERYPAYQKSVAALQTRLNNAFNNKDD